MRRLESLLLFVIVVLASACAAESPVSAPETPESAGREGTGTPADAPGGLTGDPSAGRQAFLDLKCVTCHQVEGDTGLPAPFAANAGPMLARSLATRDVEYLTLAITAPSHAMSVDVSEEVKRQMKGVLSPMPDYGALIAEQQLADLLAFLRSSGR